MLSGYPTSTTISATVAQNAMPGFLRDVFILRSIAMICVPDPGRESNARDNRPEHLSGLPPAGHDYCPCKRENCAAD
jgi:hypothetical protein